MTCGDSSDLKESYEEEVLQSQINEGTKNESGDVTIKFEHSFNQITIPNFQEDKLLFASMTVYEVVGEKDVYIENWRVNPPLYLTSTDKPECPEIKVYKESDSSKNNNIRDAWINDDATVVIGSAFQTAGIKKYTYRSDGAQEIESTVVTVEENDHTKEVEFTINTEGVTTVYAKLTDGLDTESLEISEEVKIDKKAPTITIEGNNHAGTFWGGIDLPKIHVEDPGNGENNSGVDASSFFYFWSDSSYENEALNEELFSENNAHHFAHSEQITTIPKDLSGTYYLYVMAKDKAGNATYLKSDPYRIDEVSPTIEFGEGNGTGDQWKTSTNVGEVTVTVNDGDGSDLNNSELKYLWAHSDESDKTSEDFESASTFTSGSPINIKNTIDGTIEGEYYLWIYAEDNVGNYSIEKSNVFKLDDVIPNIEVTLNKEKSDYLSKSDTLTITASDGNGSGLNDSSLKYLWSAEDKGEPTEQIFDANAKTFSSGNAINIEFEHSGSYYLYVMAKDNANNANFKKEGPYNVDDIGPTIDLGDSLNGTNNDWKKSEGITITVNVTDDDGGSGLNNSKLKYLWEKGSKSSSKTYADFPEKNSFNPGDTINITTIGDTIEGEYYLWIYAEDNAGNSVITSTAAFKLDDVAPSINVTLNKAKSDYLSKSDTLTITASDGNGSGLNDSSLKYLWSAEDKGEPTEQIFDVNAKTFSSGNAINIEFEHSGSYYLYVLAKDNANNANFKKEGPYNVDDIGPTINLGESLNGTNDVWKKSEGITITVNVTDDDGGSGLNDSKLKYLWEKGSKSSSKIYADFPADNSFNPGEPINITTIGDTIEGEYYLWIYAEDNAGNSVITSTAAFKLDDVKPNITNINPFDNPRYSKAETINIAIEENGSGIDANNFKYQWTETNNEEQNEETYTQLVSGNVINSPEENGIYYLHILVKDVVGNKATEISGPYKIDVTAPVIKIDPLTNEDNLSIKEPTVTIDDGLLNESEVKAYYLWHSVTESTEPVAGDFHTPLGADKVVPPNSDGTYYLYIYAIDEAGNDSIAKSGTFQIDTHIPDAPKIVAKTTLENGNEVEIHDNGTVNESQNVIFEFTLKEIDIEKVKNLEVTVTKDSQSPENKDVTSKGHGVYELGLSDHTTGKYTVTVKAISTYGNESASATFTISIKADAPNIPNLNIQAFDEATNNGTNLKNNETATKQVKIMPITSNDDTQYTINIYKRTDVTLESISLYSEIDNYGPGTDKTSDYMQKDGNYVIDEPGMFDIYLTSTKNGISSVVVQHITIKDDEAPIFNKDNITDIQVTEYESIDGQINATDNLKVEGYKLTNGPTLGTLELNEITGEYKYTATTSYGNDEFSIVAYDHTGNTSAAITIKVTIIKILTESDCVPSSSTTFTVKKNETHTISLYTTDKNGNAIHYKEGKTPTHGSITVGTSYLTYQPTNDYTGDDSFTIMANIDNSSAIEIVFKVSVVNSTTSHGGGSGSGGGSSKKTKTYTITVKVGDHGSVDPDGTIEVEEKKSVTLTIMPDKNYIIDKILVDGKTIDTVTKYTFEKVTDNHDFEVTFKLENPEVVENTLAYVDVSPNDWYSDAVKFVTENNLMNGMGNNTFSPNTTLTRGMLVTVLYRLANANSTATATFADVDPNMYYSAPIAWASANNIVNGVGENNFAPEAEITREQMATIFARYIENLGIQITDAVENTEYADASAMSDYAVDAIAKLTRLGLMQGKSTTTFDPQGTATRAETATLLMRFVQKTNNK